jgi:phosphoribosylaminoimidazole (AIR) synthetase
MKGFYWAYDLNGAKVPVIKPFVIPTATAIEQGEIVLHTPGTGIAVVAGK